MGQFREQHPITFWAWAILGILFLVVEAAILVQVIRTPCEGCIDEGAGLFYAPLMFAVLAVPVGLVGLLADAVRHRLRSGNWRATPEPPPRPDSSPN